MAVNTKKDYGSTKNRKPDITNLVYGKVPPQAPAMEEAVLGVLMLEKEKMNEVFKLLRTPDCFYVDAHQKVYAAMLQLQNDGSPIDLLTVTEQLSKMDSLDTVGGPYYLTQLTMNVVTGAHVQAHAQVILAKYIQRELIRTCGQVISEAYNDGCDIMDLMGRVESEIFNMRKATVKRTVTHISGIVTEVLEEADELRIINSNITGVPTGNNDMDEATKGWQDGTLNIIAARPSVGKTSYALNISLEAAMRNVPVLFFSLETKRHSLVKRLISALSNVHLDRLRVPSLQTPDEQTKIQEISKKMMRLPLYFDDTPSLSLPELKAKVMEEVSKHNVQMVVLDYLQLMKGDSNESWNRENEISQISRGLKTLALELEIPIIALCQLNRSVESRQVRTYKLSDLRESGAIEQDADMVLFLHVPTKEDFKVKDEKDLHTAGVFIEKNREGKRLKVPYLFNKDTQRWSEYTLTPNVDEPF